LDDWDLDKKMEEKCVAEGALWLRHAWDRDAEFFEGGFLGGLFH